MATTADRSAIPTLDELELMKLKRDGATGASKNWSSAVAVVSLTAGMALSISSLFNWSGVAYSSTGDRRIAFAAGTLAVGVSIVALSTRRSLLAWNVVFGFFALQMTSVTVTEIEEHSYEYAAFPQAQVQPSLRVAVWSSAVILAIGAVSLLLWIGLQVSQRARKPA